MVFEKGKEYKIWYQDIKGLSGFFGRFDEMTGMNNKAYLFVGTRGNEGEKFILGKIDIVDSVGA